MPVVRKVLDTDDTFREQGGVGRDPRHARSARGLALTRPDGWEDELEHLTADEASAAAAADEEKAEKEPQRRLKAAETAAPRPRSA